MAKFHSLIISNIKLVIFVLTKEGWKCVGLCPHTTMHLHGVVFNRLIYSHTIQWVPGALSLEVRRPGCESDHSPPSSAEVKNAWIYTSTPTILLQGVVLSKTSDNFNYAQML